MIFQSKILKKKKKDETVSLSCKPITLIHQHDTNKNICSHFDFISDMEMGGWSIIPVPRGEVHSLLPIFPDMRSEKGMYAIRACSKYC